MLYNGIVYSKFILDALLKCSIEIVISEVKGCQRDVIGQELDYIQTILACQ